MRGGSIEANGGALDGVSLTLAMPPLAVVTTTGFRLPTPSSAQSMRAAKSLNIASKKRASCFREMACAGVPG